MPFASSTPSIRIFSSGSRSDPHAQFRRTSSASQVSTAAVPMAIPNAREVAPPPLPPPRYISALDVGQDPGWQWSNSRAGPDSGAKVKEGSSLLLGSLSRSTGPNESGGDSSRFGSRRSSQNSSNMLIDPEIQGSEGWDHSDDDRRGLVRPSLGNWRLHSETQLGHRAMHSSTQAYDKQLLSKIGGPKSPGRPSGSNATSGRSESGQSPQDNVASFPPQLKPLSMSEQRYPPLDSPSSRWPQSAISPRAGFRSPLFEHDSTDNSFSSRQTSAAVGDVPEDVLMSGHSHRNSVDHSVFLDPELADDNGMGKLDIKDHSPSASEDMQYGAKGLKRRASSPPSDGPREDRTSGTSSDLYHRRSVQSLANRNLPHRFHPPPAHGSLSSINSSVGPRNSYASSWNASIASSLTSHGGDRLSPNMLSPKDDSAESTHGPTSPYAASSHLHRALSRPSQMPHQQKLSDNTAILQNRPPVSSSSSEPRRGSLAKMQGFFVCECCPKKPKKFESQKELDAHTEEKQFSCLYCPNRFKNKNEAERHQNSLHLRKHSWSCAALPGVHAAFHASLAHPATSDVCGYCGDEFPNPPNWDVRAEHLCQLHKFGECNQSKKFFRADHFRQHLKHSHAGTSGKWTNMLEAACMKDEAPPIPRSAQAGPSQTQPTSAGPYYIHPGSPNSVASGSASLSNIMNDPEP